jgi:ABC-type polysaccharide/polyol phosphate export permease
MLLNPATSLIVSSRSWITGGEAPLVSHFLIVSGTGLLVLTVGLITLKVALPHIIERLSGT